MASKLRCPRATSLIGLGLAYTFVVSTTAIRPSPVSVRYLSRDEAFPSEAPQERGLLSRIGGVRKLCNEFRLWRCLHVFLKQGIVASRFLFSICGSVAGLFEFFESQITLNLLWNFSGLATDFLVIPIASSQ
jgi:hypothetical protein